MSREDARLGERTTLVLAHRAQRLVGGQVALAPATASTFSRLRSASAAMSMEQMNSGISSASAKAATKRSSGIGVLAAQLVVHVQHGHRSHIARLAQGSAQIRQRRGIGAAGYHEQDGGIGHRQVVSCDGGTGLFEGSFNQVSHFPFLLLATHRGRGAG